MRSVPQSEVADRPFLWTRGVAASETLRYLDKNGVDVEAILSKAQLSRSQLSQDSGGISVASQHRFLEFAAVETNDSLLGLHVAAEMDLRDVGILFYLAAASATVAEALEHLARYSGTANEALHLEISQRQGETVLTQRPMGGHAHDVVDLAVCARHADLSTDDAQDVVRHKGGQAGGWVAGENALLDVLCVHRV